MKGEDLLDAVGGIREEYIEDADAIRDPGASAWRKWALLAAGIMLIAGAALLLRPYLKPAVLPSDTEEAPVISTSYFDEDPSAVQTGSEEQLSPKADIAAMIMENGRLYFDTWEIYTGDVDEKAVRTVTSYTDGDENSDGLTPSCAGAVPKKNGECNFDRELKTQYVILDELRLAVRLPGLEEWHIFFDRDAYKEYRHAN